MQRLQQGLMTAIAAKCRRQQYSKLDEKRRLKKRVLSHDYHSSANWREERYSGPKTDGTR